MGRVLWFSEWSGLGMPRQKKRGLDTNNSMTSFMKKLITESPRPWVETPKKEETTTLDTLKDF